MSIRTVFTLKKTVDVTLPVGNLKKTLRVFGKRLWNHTGIFSYNATIGSAIDLVKSLPGLAKKAAGIWWKFNTLPLRLANSTAAAIRAGSWGPLTKEVQQIVGPVVHSAEQLKQITAMVAVLFSEQVTRDLLLDFVDRYWDNTHPLEKTEMGAEAASEVVMTILLVIFTAGVGAAANIAAKSGRLIKVAKLLIEKDGWDIKYGLLILYINSGLCIKQDEIIKRFNKKYVKREEPFFPCNSRRLNLNQI